MTIDITKTPVAGTPYPGPRKWPEIPASDRQKVIDGLRGMPEAVAYKCPSCEDRLDIQGIERGSRIVFDMWCHKCGAHITMRLKL